MVGSPLQKAMVSCVSTVEDSQTNNPRAGKTNGVVKSGKLFSQKY